MIDFINDFELLSLSKITLTRGYLRIDVPIYTPFATIND